jgi:hypothetical protein
MLGVADLDCVFLDSLKKYIVFRLLMLHVLPIFHREVLKIILIFGYVSGSLLGEFSESNKSSVILFNSTFQLSKINLISFRKLMHFHQRTRVL